MTGRIEDYALLSDTHSAALVGRDGSIDWLTFPRFDSPACFAALLGDEENGSWQIHPRDPDHRVERRYRPGTLVLETTFTTSTGRTTLVDCMPVRADGRLDLVRLVVGVEGRVDLRMRLRVRMDYGSIVPWVTRDDDGMRMVAGPDALTLAAPVPHRPDGWSTVADFSVAAGERIPFDLAWNESHLPRPDPIPVESAIEATTAWWTEWSSRCETFDPYADEVGASLTVLKGLTYGPTGGIVAAATTSLPEHLGGSRNWDYRYCWLRDATFTLTSLLDAGYTDEARSWRDWLLRAVAGRPEDVQIMYGPAGEHRLAETELDWLAGYEGSAPVRVGNGAHDQLQLDVFGEVMDAFLSAHHAGVADDEAALAVGRALTSVLEHRWREPDDGIWEVRAGRSHFTHSKVMAWVALDRSIRLFESTGTADAPLARWRATRDEIRATVLARGVDDQGVFRQTLDGTALDASLLAVPLVGFLPADDPRVEATVAAIRAELGHDGLIRRYDPTDTDDGVGGAEGTFLLCTFWLADVLLLQGKRDEATQLFDRLLGLRNDVGLLSEMYDPEAGRMLGNFPQAFSHTALVATGIALSKAHRGEPQAWRRG